MDDIILKLENITVEYENKNKYTEAIIDVNLDIKKGEIFGLVGESGSGKSTLGKTILRLLPHTARIKNGKIIFKGEDIILLPEKKMNKKIRGKEIAMVMQNPQNALNPVFKIGSQVLDVLYFKSDNKLRRRSLKGKAIEILRKVGISEPEYRFNEYPHQFSGGMKQRVMLAMAFISNPSLLIADEPTSALDLTVEAQILHLLGDLVEEYGTSIFYISHDLGVINGITSRIAVMYSGKIVEISETEELFNNPCHPYTSALLKCLPDYKSNNELATISGQVPDLNNRPTGCNFNPRCQYSFNLCRKEEPELMEIDSGHYSACFLENKAEEI